MVRVAVQLRTRPQARVREAVRATDGASRTGEGSANGTAGGTDGGPSGGPSGAPTGDGTGQPTVDPGPEDLAWAVEVASRVLPGTHNCLVQSLACQRLLADHGYAATLHIGARLGGEGAVPMEAHAWVEHGGRPLLGVHDDTETFQPLR